MITDLMFDFFGTLVTYTPGRFGTTPYTATHQVLRAHGFDLAYDDFAQHFTAAFQDLDVQAQASHTEFHMHEVGRRFLAQRFNEAVSHPLLDQFIETYITEWNRGTSFLPDIQPWIERLGTRYRLSILSNTHYPDLIHRNLRAMQIASSFAQVITSVEYGVRKPNATIFHHAMHQLGIAPTEVLYIGDTYRDDYEGAAAAGVRCILVDPDDRYASLVPDRVRQLFDLEAYLE